MPPMPMPGGMPPGMPPMGAPGGMPGMPGGGGMPPMPDDPTQQMGMVALDRLMNKPPSGQIRMQRVIQALQMASKLVAAVLPEVAETQPKTSKNLHIIGRQIADAILTLQEDNEPGPPPENLFAGLGAAGLPGVGLPGSTGG